MYKIPWNTAKTSKNGYIIDLSDLRLILYEYPNYWQLSISLKAYSADKSKSAFRPTANIIQFEKPCDIEQAKESTEAYINEFITSLLDSLK